MWAKGILRSFLCESLDSYSFFASPKTKVQAYCFSRLCGTGYCLIECITVPRWASELEQDLLVSFGKYSCLFWHPLSFPPCRAQFFTICINWTNDFMARTKSMRWHINLIEAYEWLRRGNGDLHARCFYSSLFLKH